MEEDHPHHEESKLIVANKCSFKGCFIDTGKLGLVGSDKHYILGDNLELLKEFLESKLCLLIAHFTKYRQDFLEKDAFDYIPDIRKIMDNYDKEYIYKYFKFTSQELQIIESL